MSPSTSWTNRNRPGDFLLKEDSGFLLLENGGRIILSPNSWSERDGESKSWTDRTKPTPTWTDRE